MTREERFVLALFEGATTAQAARQAGFDDGIPSAEAIDLFEAAGALVDQACKPAAPREAFIDRRHRAHLERAMAHDEQWTTLAGYLYDPESERDCICPESMAEYVAHRYVFTSRGRLFFLRADGQISERKTTGGRFQITCAGARWNPTVKAMMARVYPQTLVDDYDISDGADAWLEHLAERATPARPPVMRRAATFGELDSMAHRFR